MRSWIFVPGHSPRMLDKSFALDVDVIMLDLEDGVVPELKSDARRNIAAALDAHPAEERPSRYVRVNGFGSADLALDLPAVLHPRLNGIVVPKVETVDQVHE